MNKQYLTIGIAILLVVGSFFFGKCTADCTEIKKVVVTTPEIKGSSPLITNPKPIIQKEDVYIHDKDTIHTENPYNKELADRYTKLENEKDKLQAYLNSIQVKKYTIPYEDDKVKITGDFETQGDLLSAKYNYILKPQSYELDAEVPKEKIRILSINLGGGLTVTKKLDKLEPSVNLDIVGKKNNVLSLGYGTEGTYSAKYTFNVFNIKK